MEVVFGLDQVKKTEPCAITIGTFDGVHLGHLKIIARLRKVADQKKLCATLITFEPHPRLVVQKQRTHHVQLLTTLEEKLEILRQQPLDRVIVVKFDQEFSQIHYEDFVKEVLIGKLAARALVVGYDHSFGRNREGNFSNLEKIKDRYGYDLYKVEPYELQGNIVSSTFIRQYLRDGDVEMAGLYLGRRYSITGKVVSGCARGKLLHFPTANLDLENKFKLVPNNGVYAVDVRYQEKMFKGMMNIGYKPTFEEHGDLSVEVHIIGFDKQIYGEYLTVYFKKRLRNEKKFASKEELIAQLEADREKSLKL